MKLSKVACLSLSASALLVGCANNQSKSPAKLPDGFIATFLQAHDRRDLDAFSKLVCWDRVPSDMRKLSEDSFKTGFDDRIVSIRLSTDHPQGRPEVYVKDGITYGLNLPVVAELVTENQPLSKGATSETYYPLGAKDGVYCIAQMAPVENPEPRAPATNAPKGASAPSQAAKPGGAAQPLIVPANTDLVVRLVEDLGMKTAKAGGSFSATIVQPVVVNGVTVIPEGSPVQGFVTKKDNYSPEATVGSLTVNGTAHKISTGQIIFNESVAFPAGSRMKFVLLFPLDLNR